MIDINNNKSDKIVFSWISKDYDQFQKGRFWQIIMLIVVVATATLGVFLNSWTFSLLIIVFAFVYYIVHKTPSKDLEIRLTEIGIGISNSFYPYGNISSFSILYTPPSTKKLIIYIKNDILGERRIELGEMDSYAISEFLKTKVPEGKGKADSFIDYLNKYLKL